MAEAGEPLPERVEERLFAIHFEAPPDERDARLEDLCGRHPEHAMLLRDRYRALQRSEGLLGHVHQELQQRVPYERIGPFEILRVLGEGGFGTVYLAEQHEPVRRMVALKVLDTGRGDTRSRRRFEDERHLLARLQHACIAQIHDAGVTERGLPYFAMEHIDGAPITTWCDRNDADIETRLRLFVRCCAAVQHAHQREIVHRDLKPCNVLVQLEDGRPLPKVIDFGIAKLLTDDPTLAHQRTIQGGQVGTPGYMSPEQAAGETVDTRTDVYSLGVLLCELLTGQLPLPRERLAAASMAAMARMLATDAPRRPSGLVAAHAERGRAWRRRLQDDLDWIVLRAVAPEREQRYASVAALADDVERHLRGEPVLARQRATAYVVRKFVKRHRIGVAAGLLVLVSVIAVISSLSWGLGVTELARSRAEQDRDLARARERAARMAVAQLALNSGDVETARANLTDIPASDRGWEWRHLAAQSDTSSKTIAIGDNCLDVLWLDERHVASFPMFDTPTVWNLETGEAERQFAWRGIFRRLAFDADSGHVILAGDEGVGLWDTATGERLRDLGGAPGEILSLDWSADRKTIAVGGKERWLMLVDVADGTCRARLRTPANATAVALIDDAHLCVGCDDGGLHVLAIDDGSVVRSLVGHLDIVAGVLVDRFRDRIYSTSFDGTVRAWQLGDGQPIARMPCNVHMRQLSLSADGDVLYACGGWSDSMLAAWETGTFQPLGRYHGHELGIYCLELSHDQSQIATASRDGTLRTWRARPPTRAERLEPGRDVRVLSRSEDGTRFGTASFDGRISVWNAHTLDLELQVETGKVWTGSALAGDTFYVVGSQLCAYDVPSGELLQTVSVHGRRVETMIVDPECRWLGGGFLDHYLVWRLPDLELLHDLELPVSSARSAWDATTGCFVIAGDRATLFWIDPQTGQLPRREVLADLDKATGSIALRGDQLVTGFERSLLMMRGGETRHRTQTRNTCAAISDDGSRLVTGGSDKKVRWWDMATGEQLLVFDEPAYPVESVHLVDREARVIALAHRWSAPSYVYVWSAPQAVEIGR